MEENDGGRRRGGGGGTKRRNEDFCMEYNSGRNDKKSRNDYGGSSNRRMNYDREQKSHDMVKERSSWSYMDNDHNAYNLEKSEECGFSSYRNWSTSKPSNERSDDERDRHNQYRGKNDYGSSSSSANNRRHYRDQKYYDRRIRNEDASINRRSHDKEQKCYDKLKESSSSNRKETDYKREHKSQAARGGEIKRHHKHDDHGNGPHKADHSKDVELKTMATADPTVAPGGQTASFEAPTDEAMSLSLSDLEYSTTYDSRIHRKLRTSSDYAQEKCAYRKKDESREETRKFPSTSSSYYAYTGGGNYASLMAPYSKK